MTCRQNDRLVKKKENISPSTAKIQLCTSKANLLPEPFSSYRRNTKQTMSQLSHRYDPHAFEAAVYKEWEDSGAFQPRKKAGRPYVIMLPPPNITGSLHMGHALQDTLMDILVRYHRMKGESVLWLPGTDHAALPTNKIIVDQLAGERKTPSAIGREAFLERARQWYTKTGAHILQQMKRLGVSADWSRNRFTMDEAYTRAVQEAFVRYFAKGYIYRGARIVNWDPGTKTTVSDLEIEYRTERAPYYYLRYGPFEISTARPETKFGDKYVVMHPQDTRYAQYKHGDTFETEWINGPVTATIIKDEAVDPTVGSGVMTITPWHSVVDFDIAERHQLDLEQIIDFEGKLLPIAQEFAGLPIAKARPKIVAQLGRKGLLIKIDQNYEHNVALSDRGKNMIEPQVMRQWFVDMSKLKAEAIAVAEKDIIRFVPPRWKRHFLTWMKSVRDWNISRQIWLGHRIPVWWKSGTHGTDREDGNFVVSIAKPEGEYEQDPDVLDTWFSSALWPLATLGWPNNTPDLKTFYPTSVLVTAREILYLWVARMIFSGLDLMPGSREERIPFRDVLIHPVVLARDGRRMSKSLGTGVDPLVLIEKYGADATRFGLMQQMNYDTQAIKFDEEAIKSGRNFANKLWNIARLLEGNESEGETVADQWITHRYNEARRQFYQLLDEYKIGEAARLLYGFIWGDFADWYLEIIKHEGSRDVARAVFVETLKLVHPIMPFITEVIWKNLGRPGLLLTAPLARDLASTGEYAEVEAAMRRWQNIVNTVRSARSLLAIPPTAIINVWAEGHVLPKALAAVTRSTLLETESNAFLRFPLRGQSGYVGIASSSITPDSIEQAKKRLDTTIADLIQRLEHLAVTIERMKDKVSPEAMAEKEWQKSQLIEQLAQAKESRAALG